MPAHMKKKISNEIDICNLTNEDIYSPYDSEDYQMYHILIFSFLFHL